MKIPIKLEPLYKEQYRFYPIYGGRCAGKTYGVAPFFVYKAANGFPCVACREIAKLLDDNILLSFDEMIDTLKVPGFTIVGDRIRHVSGGYIRAMGLKGGSKKETRTRIKGLDKIKYCLLDEAESATTEILDTLSKTIRMNGNMQVYLYNRYLEADDVHKMFVLNKPPNTFPIYMNYYDNPDCPSDEYEQAEALKKADYDHWLYIYGGEPMSQAAQAIVSRPAVAKAMGRTADTTGQVQIGADIARYGDDTTVFFKRKGITVIDVKEYKKQGIPETYRQLMDFAERGKDVKIKIDDSGLGGGVTDLMHEAGYNIIPINNGSKAKDEDKYPNAISEQWFEFAEKIHDVVLPEHDRLKMELTSRFYKVDSKGRRQVESKDEYKKRGFTSPDYADACLLSFYEPYGMDFDRLGKIEVKRKTFEYSH